MSDVGDKALSRLAYQFSDSPKFKAFIDAFSDEFQILADNNLQLLNERYLNTAVGVQLDGIGDIIGLSRPYKEVSSAGLFGFDDDTTALGFGTLLSSTVGGNFIKLGQNFVLIGDDSYRLLIRAKIVQNKIVMTVEETIELISFMFGGVVVRYQLPVNLSPRYSIGRTLTSFELSLLNDLPLLIGIGTVTYDDDINDPLFGFSADSTALGFGLLLDADTGGRFIKL